MFPDRRRTPINRWTQSTNPITTMALMELTGFIPMTNIPIQVKCVHLFPGTITLTINFILGHHNSPTDPPYIKPPKLVPKHYHTTHRPTERTATSPKEYPNGAIPPDTCDTSYDAVAVIRRELFIFKDKVLGFLPVGERRVLLNLGHI